MLKKSIGALALACTMLFTPITAIASDTVAIVIGNQKAVSGGSFSTNINLADIPSEGISAMDFAISYDKDIISIDTLTDIAGGELDYAVDKDNGRVNVTYVASSGITSSGALLKVSGKVLSKALTGSKSEITIVPISRKSYVGSSTDNTEINIGYVADNEVTKYDVAVTSGCITVTANGDVNKDGYVNATDASIVLKYILNGDAKDYDILSADIAEEYGTIDMRDVIEILNN